MLRLFSIIYSNNCLIIKQVTFMPGWGGGDLLYEVTGMLSGKLKLNLGGVNVGVAQAQTDPKGDHTKTDI